MTPRRPTTTTTSSSLASHLSARSLPASLPRDVLSFLTHYPSSRPDSKKTANLRFYRNEAPALPRPATCDELQRELRGNWDELERRHDFVQWLFPIRCVC